MNNSQPTQTTIKKRQERTGDRIEEGTLPLFIFLTVRISIMKLQK